MICPKCSQETLEYPFCSKCGKKMTEECPICSADHPIGTIWCPTQHKNIPRHIEATEIAKKASEMDLIQAKLEKRGVFIGRMEMLGLTVWLVQLIVIWIFTILAMKRDPSNNLSMILFVIACFDIVAFSLPIIVFRNWAYRIIQKNTYLEAYVEAMKEK